MPKSILRESRTATKKDKARLMWSVVAKYMNLRRVSYEDIAVKMHRSPQCLRNRNKNPETLTIEEMLTLIDILKIPPEEMAEVIPGRRILLMEGDRLM